MSKPDPSPPPLSHEHIVRVSALEPERTWKISGDTLFVSSQGQADFSIPLNSIAKVRLTFDPSRFQTNRFRCHLHNSQTNIATIQNQSYQGFASFSDHSESYAKLVNILIPRIASLNPNAKFISGTSYSAWIANMLVIIVSFSLLFLVLFLMAAAIPALIIVKLILLACFIPTLIRWFKTNKPSSFNPHSIPQNLLPNNNLQP